MATALAAAASSSSSSGPQNWSDLLDELLHSILLRLSCIRDLLAFSAVCRSWRSFTIAASPTSLFPPLLVFPLLKHRARRRRRLPSSALQLLDPAIPPQIVPPKILNRSPIDESILSLPFLSSSHGHLLFLTRRREILVVNFITGRQITSPVLPSDHILPSNSRLAQLTAPISSSNCSLVFLTVDYLLLWRINSPGWISHHLRVRLTNLRQMVVVGKQIVVVGRSVWALEFGNMLSIIELPQELCPKELLVQCKRDILPSFMNARLVDCEGEILCVCFAPFIGVVTSKVEVFRVDMFNGHIILVKKNNLGNRSLFLSAAVNVPGCVCNDPERWGGKNNCIYYAWCDNKDWSVLEVGGFASRSLLEQADRSTCSFPFWNFASILQ